MFRKTLKTKPATLDSQLADVLENILNRGKYEPTNRNTRYMCCILKNLAYQEEISCELASHGERRIGEYLRYLTQQPYIPGTMFGLILSEGDIDRMNQFFEWRIHGSNHFRKLIRQLRSGKFK